MLQPAALLPAIAAAQPGQSALPGPPAASSWLLHSSSWCAGVSWQMWAPGAACQPCQGCWELPCCWPPVAVTRPAWPQVMDLKISYVYLTSNIRVPWGEVHTAFICFLYEAFFWQSAYQSIVCSTRAWLQTLVSNRCCI